MKKIKSKGKKGCRTAIIETEDGKFEKVELIGLDEVNRLIDNAPDQKRAQHFREWLDTILLPSLKR